MSTSLQKPVVIRAHMQTLVINWPLSSMTGYGNYGLQILDQFLKRPNTGLALTDFPVLPLRFSPHMHPSLKGRLDQAIESARFLESHPSEILTFPSPVLHGVGNCYAAFRHQFRVKGKPNIGCAAIEEAICPADWRPFMKIYDRFIAISAWNKDFLESLNLGVPIDLCHQGIDASIFFPRAKTSRYASRFVIFSGGKFEFRKGQDIVVAAFKRFHATHSDALLLTAWQNGQTPDPLPFISSGHSKTVPVFDSSKAQLDVGSWLLSQGLPVESFVDLGWRHNETMPEILRDCDAAIFPNRCEGGTNLVAMEAIATGVPVILSANTGHLDLARDIGCKVLKEQKSVTPAEGIMSVNGWGESQVDELVAALEFAYDHAESSKAEAAVQAEQMARWNWPLQNEKLLRVIFGEN